MKKAERAFSLAEVLLAAALFGVVLLCMIQVVFPAFRLWNDSESYGHIVKTSAAAIRRIDKELRMSAKDLILIRKQKDTVGSKDSLYFISPMSGDGKILSRSDLQDDAPGADIVWRSEALICLERSGELVLYRLFWAKENEFAQLRPKPFDYLMQPLSGKQKTVWCDHVWGLSFDCAQADNDAEQTSDIFKISKPPIFYTIFFEITVRQGKKRNFQFGSSLIPLNGKGAL